LEYGLKTITVLTSAPHSDVLFFFSEVVESTDLRLGRSSVESTDLRFGTSSVESTDLRLDFFFFTSVAGLFSDVVESTDFRFDFFFLTSASASSVATGISSGIREDRLLGVDDFRGDLGDESESSANVGLVRPVLERCLRGLSGVEGLESD